MESLDYESLGTCEPCLMGKMTKTPFSGTMERATDLLQYDYLFKSENNCYSIHMNKTFYCHTPNVNGLLNLNCSGTHIHNIEANRCKVNNDSATYLWHYSLGHIGVKCMKKLHKRWIFGITWL